MFKGKIREYHFIFNNGAGRKFWFWFRIFLKVENHFRFLKFLFSFSSVSQFFVLCNHMKCSIGSDICLSAVNKYSVSIDIIFYRPRIQMSFSCWLHSACLRTADDGRFNRKAIKTSSYSRIMNQRRRLALPSKFRRKLMSSLIENWLQGIDWTTFRQPEIVACGDNSY